MRRKKIKTIVAEEAKRDSKMKYVRVTDKITILVPRFVPDDEARQEFLLKIEERDRRRNPRNDIIPEP